MAINSELVLPPIPSKRFFSIGETAKLCGVKPHVLRYWEQEFTQLRPSKRNGGRRYYQQKDVALIRDIRSLLYQKRFTISGAKQALTANRTLVDHVILQEVALPKSVELAKECVQLEPNKVPGSLIRSLIKDLEVLLENAQSD